MKLSLKKLSRFGFNQRVLTERDFYDICEKENIIVVEREVYTSFYFTTDEYHFIVIKKSLKGMRKTFSMFHELSHHFLHGGRDTTNAFYFGMLETKAEFEADALALIALIPLPSLKNFAFLEEHPNRYARKLYRDRIKLNFLYGV